MRILHVSDVYLPRLGGIEMQVSDLADHQRRHGHHVTVMTTTTRGDHIDDGHTLRTPLDRARVRGVLSSVAPDVVHCHSSGLSPLAWRTAHQALRIGLPVVTTMHSVVPAVGPVAAAIRTVVRAQGPGMRWTAVSSMSAAALTPMVPTPVGIMPNGVDAGSWSPAAPGAADVPTVVAVMRLTRRKRVVPLVKVLARVHELVPTTAFRAVIAGEGPQHRAAQRAVRACGLDDRVDLVGRLTRPEVGRLLAGGDVFVAPARLESFGIAALEARCAGLPVVAMRDGGVGEFVSDRSDGFLVDDDAEMAQRIAELVADRSLLQRMGHHSRATPTTLDWGATVGRVQAHYRAAGATARDGSLDRLRA